MEEDGLDRGRVGEEGQDLHVPAQADRGAGALRRSSGGTRRGVSFSSFSPCSGVRSVASWKQTSAGRLFGCAGPLRELASCDEPVTDSTLEQLLDRDGGFQPGEGPSQRAGSHSLT